MKLKPYVGITGFKTVEEVEIISKIYRENGFLGEKEHIPMYGFASSEKRLANPHSGGRQTPSAKDLGKLVRACPEGSLPMIHYFTRDVEGLVDQIEDVFSIDDMYKNGDCRALQLNMAWPKIKDLEKIRNKFPDMQIVLSVNKEAMQDSYDNIIENTKKYNGIIEYALIDPSGGKGKNYSPIESGVIYSGLEDVLPQATLGFAGGLSGDNLERQLSDLQASYQEPFYSPFSIDAQGKLMDKVDGNDILNIDKARKYIEAAAKIF